MTSTSVDWDRVLRGIINGLKGFLLVLVAWMAFIYHW